MRRRTPKNAKLGSKQFRKYWTATGHEGVFYRHNDKGAVVYGTSRVNKTGQRAWHTLSSAHLEAAKKEARQIRTSKVDKAPRSAMPTVRDYLDNRVRTAVQNGHQDQSTRKTTGFNLDQILEGYRHRNANYRKNEQGKLIKRGDGACPAHILDKHVDRVTEEDLDAWFANCFLNPFSLSATKGMWTVWKLLFALARKDSLIFAVPQWKVPTREATGREERYKLRTDGKQRALDVITTDEFFDLVADIRNNGHKQEGISEDSANWCALLGTTGLRKGELRELRWGNVRWEDRRLVLEGRTKSNRRGAQYLPLNPDAIRILRRMWASGHTRESYIGPSGKERVKRVHKGSRNLNDDDYVSPFLTAQDALRRSCERLRIPTQTPHGLRHFFACECVDQGIPWTVLAEWLGHTDGGRVAAETYAHVRRGGSENFADGWSLGKKAQRAAC